MAGLDAERKGVVVVGGLQVASGLPMMSPPRVMDGRLGSLCMWPLPFVCPGVGVPKMAGLVDDLGVAGDLVVRMYLCPGVGFPNMAGLDVERDGDGVRVRDLPLVKALPPKSSPLTMSGKMVLLGWLPWVFVCLWVGVPKMAGLADDPGGVGELAVASSMCPGAGVPKMAGLVAEHEGEGVRVGVLPRVWSLP